VQRNYIKSAQFEGSKSSTDYPSNCKAELPEGRAIGDVQKAVGGDEEDKRNLQQTGINSIRHGQRERNEQGGVVQLYVSRNLGRNVLFLYRAAG
jgi:hypothetical protein